MISAKSHVDPCATKKLTLCPKRDNVFPKYQITRSSITPKYCIAKNPTYGAQRRAKRERKFKNGLKKGDLVVTKGGIHGRVIELNDMA